MSRSGLLSIKKNRRLFWEILPRHCDQLQDMYMYSRLLLASFLAQSLLLTYWWLLKTWRQLIKELSKFNMKTEISYYLWTMILENSFNFSLELSIMSGVDLIAMDKGGMYNQYKRLKSGRMKLVVLRARCFNFGSSLASVIRILESLFSGAKNLSF